MFIQRWIISNWGRVFQYTWRTESWDVRKAVYFPCFFPMAESRRKRSAPNCCAQYRWRIQGRRRGRRRGRFWGRSICFSNSWNHSHNTTPNRILSKRISIFCCWVRHCSHEKNRVDSTCLVSSLELRTSNSVKSRFDLAPGAATMPPRTTSATGMRGTNLFGRMCENWWPFKTSIGFGLHANECFRGFKIVNRLPNGPVDFASISEKATPRWWSWWGWWGWKTDATSW